MDSILNGSYWLPLILTFSLYLISLAFYRLFLDPLARFPGPKLAALSRFYEAYHDVVRNGQYTFKIAELHKKYGTVAMISMVDCVLTSAFRSNCEN